MTLSQALRLFADRLGHLYPPAECKSMGRLYFEQRMGLRTVDFLLRADQVLDASEAEDVEVALVRLETGEPIQYVLGKAWFMGMHLDVAPGVLIPRPETEELVQWILTDYGGTSPAILDVGTGSGCIAVALAQNIPLAQVQAWDVSPGALTIAARNAESQKCQVDFRLVDVLNPPHGLLSGYLDVLVSNPPYVTQREKAAMHVNVLGHEPHLALFVDDDDPLLFYRRIAELGQQLLKPNGCIYFEINEHFGPDTLQLLRSLGYSDVTLRCDIHGKDRMAKGRWGGAID